MMTMVEIPSAAALSPEVAVVNELMQRGVLKAGYSYVVGDDASWPASPVIMVKEQNLLLISPWATAYDEAVLAQWGQFAYDKRTKAGLLLIGTLPVDVAAIDALFTRTIGAVVYLDARTRQFRSRQLAPADTLPPLREEELTRLLAAPAPGLEAIDCRAALRAHLAEQRATLNFRAATTQAVGVRTPWATYLLIAICVAVYLIMSFSHSLTDFISLPGERLLEWGALFGPLVRQGDWWRIITHAFLHAGLVHIGFNMYAMYVFGSLLEKWQGHGRLLALFLFSAVTGALLSLLVQPNVVAVGASGGLFGLLGAMIALLLRHQKDFPTAMREHLLRSLMKLLLLNLLISFLPGISMAAHLGGLFGGFVLGLLITRSPIKSSALSREALLGLATLLVATAFAGYLIVMHLPVN